MRKKLSVFCNYCNLCNNTSSDGVAATLITHLPAQTALIRHPPDARALKEKATKSARFDSGRRILFIYEFVILFYIDFLVCNHLLNP